MRKPRMAVATALSLVAYLGLAIVGAAACARFLFPPLIAVSLVTIVLGFAALFSEGHVGSGVKEGRSNRWVIAPLAVLGFIDAYLPAYTHRIDFLAFGGDAGRWLGVLLSLRRGSSPCARLHTRAPLQRTGCDSARTPAGHNWACGIVRHPSYLGLFVLMLGWG